MRYILLCFFLFVAPFDVYSAVHNQDVRKIGVIFVVHGGSNTTNVASLWDFAMQIFSYDPNSAIYKRVIWNEKAWPTVVSFGDGASYSNIASQIKKYEFQDDRIGGTDPSPMKTVKQLNLLSEALTKKEKEMGVKFYFDRAQFIGPGDQTMYLPDPRMLYYPKTEGGSMLRYCGSDADLGPWQDCDIERYNVDGPAERLLSQGVDEILMIDMTTAGVRFWKTYEVVRVTREVVNRYNIRNKKNIVVTWLNDPTDLMRESFPVMPKNWTRSLGPPEEDSSVSLDGRPNPVTNDPEFAALYIDGIMARLNPKVSHQQTAIMFINHATRDWNEVYDPKINDTVVLNNLIKDQIINTYPDFDPDNFIGTWMGLRVENPNINLSSRVRSQLERSRGMRGENLGHRWFYETDKEPPGGDERFFYWEGLEYLKNRGVKHIVIVFTQVVIDSVLTLVEVPNQIGKEIGVNTWLYFEKGDYERYPKHGNPFADYWGRQVEKMCRPVGSDFDQPRTEICCFTMGGCGTQQPYPPERQTPINFSMEDTDPHLVYDLPAFGHIGYNELNGKPSNEKPVQSQYNGTWELWDPINEHPSFGQVISKHIISYLSDSNISK